MAFAIARRPLPSRSCSYFPIALAAVSVLASQQAAAFELTNDHPDWQVRWDNTIKLSTIYRLKNADPALNDSFRLLVPGVSASAFPQALNFNAGDQNFQRRGFVSERFDLLSEFDAVYQRHFGVRLSAAGWYDHEYHQSTRATDSAVGQSPIDGFPARTRRIAGRDAEVLDAFVFGTWALGGNRKVTLRLGQHALQYGESLFFGDNGVARAQGPIDAQKALASPNVQFKEIILPVPQVSTQLQLGPNLSIGAYYQFRWMADRLPPAGSYFSTVNIPWGASQPEIVAVPSGPVAGTYLLAPGVEQRPRHSGQFGLQLRWSHAETDFGLYLARFHDKDGQLYSALNLPPANAPAFGSGSWSYVFPEDVKVLGASASRSLGQFNIAVEGSIRDDMPLRSTNMVYAPLVQAAPRPAKGRTAHLNVSWLASLGPSLVSREASLLGEVAWNRVLHKDDPDNTLDAGRSRDATILRVLYSPTYRQVAAGVDISVPVGLAYTLAGNSAVTPAWGARHTGEISLGLEGVYLDEWRLALNYQRYLGKAVPFVDYSGLVTGGPAIFGHGNALKDRDYVSFSLRHTF